MNKAQLREIWEKVRNESWQKQESFVNVIIDELVSHRNLLKFFAEDKYVGSSGFKHVEGRVNERVMEELRSLRLKIKALEELEETNVKE